MPVNRVRTEDLDYPGDDGLHYLNGVPFTGVVEYRADDGSWLEAEEEYRDGEIWGRKLTWFPSGQLCEEAEYGWGRLHGTSREWDETGRLIRESTHQYGIKTSERRFGPGGEVISEFQATENTWERVRKYRAALETSE